MQFEMTMSLSTLGLLGSPDTVLSIASINLTRRAFIENWFGSKATHARDLSIDYPNVLFDWHKTMIANGHFEAYNYWMLSSGNPAEFEAWYGTNKEKYNAFAAWFQRTPIPIDQEFFFSRMQAEM